MEDIEQPKPSVYLHDDDVNKFQDYDVNDSFKIEAKVRVSSKSKRSFKDNKGKVKQSQSMELELSNIKMDSGSKLEGKEF